MTTRRQASEPRSPAFQAVFPPWFSGALEHEAEAKGYLHDVLVVVGGQRHHITFIDEHTLTHDGGFAASEVEVVAAITRAHLLARIADLVKTGQIARWEVEAERDG